MAFKRRDMFLLFWIPFLWNFCPTRAYLDVCESSLGTVYCDCKELSFGPFSSSYKVSCTILQNISLHDPIWRSIGDADSILYLDINPSNRFGNIMLDYIPSENLRRMKNLKVLRIEQGTLSTLRSNSVSEFPKLEELELEGNEITALEPSAISNMAELKKLTLSDNSLQEFLADTLKGLDKLESLFLDRNNISRIESCAFCNLQDLKDLELWGNQISDLTEYTFRGLRYVKRLDLSRNKITVLSDKVFHAMPVLVELDLRENMIRHIAPRAFVGLNKLQMLSLGKNNIKVLPNDVFASLLAIRSIDLYNNELEFLQKEVVDSIKISKDGFFSIGFRANPLKCDCVWNWISRYLKANKSHLFTRELQEVKCKFDNETEETIVNYLQKVDCKTSTIKPRTPMVIPNSVIKSTDSAPIELNIQKSKMKVEDLNQPLATAAIVDDNTEAFLSDVEDRGNMADLATKVNSNLVFFLTIVVLYLTKMRIGL